MAIRASAVAVHFEILDHDHSHWCLDCRLATGIRISVMITAGGVTTLQQSMRCQECGGDRIVPVSVDDAHHC